MICQIYKFFLLDYLKKKDECDILKEQLIESETSCINNKINELNDIKKNINQETVSLNATLAKKKEANELYLELLDKIQFCSITNLKL